MCFKFKIKPYKEKSAINRDKRQKAKKTFTFELKNDKISVRKGMVQNYEL